MTEEKRIGTVMAVTSSSLTVLLDESITSMEKSLFGKSYHIGQLGTYVLIPVGALTIVAVISDFRKTEITINGKAQQRYLMVVNMVGGTKDGRFERGLAVFPTVDTPVYLAEDYDLKAAFSIYQDYDFSIGTLSLFENERAYLDPNKFFGKHIAVLGSTGSGKSCTVSSVLQKVANLQDTNVVILDIHNEYGSAFRENCNRIDITELELPFWLMNFDEMREIFIDEKEESSASQITVFKDQILSSKKGKNPELANMLTVDTPVFFDMTEIRARMQYLDTEKITGLGSTAGAKEGPFYGQFTRFLVRLDSKLNDSRYAFMFKPKKYIQSESIKELLAKIFGTDGSARMTILDLSGVPFDVVNIIVSLLARITFDFNFWNTNRRNFPILLVFEEAHNYLPATGGGSHSARKTVERIAKEGRKYGVSCMIVSQRPAEVSETILSQCNNYIILRLTNPVDQNYVRRLVPDAFAGVIEILSSLRQGETLVVGDAVSMPSRVQIDYPDPEPDSADIKFFDKWKESGSRTRIADVVERWWKQERTL
jgi:hypothetical protein